MPASAASRSTASGKERPSVSIRKSKIEPFLPEEKSNHACFWSLTKNDGVFSLLNGDSPFHSRPDRCSLTRLPTTSETGSRAFSSSRNCGVKRMGFAGVGAGRPNRWHIISRQSGRLSGSSGDRGNSGRKSRVFRVIHRRSYGQRWLTSGRYVCIYNSLGYGRSGPILGYPELRTPS